jgi:hypothetical protein
MSRNRNCLVAAGLVIAAAGAYGGGAEHCWSRSEILAVLKPEARSLKPEA